MDFSWNPSCLYALCSSGRTSLLHPSGRTYRGAHRGRLGLSVIELFPAGPSGIDRSAPPTQRILHKRGTKGHGAAKARSTTHRIRRTRGTIRRDGYASKQTRCSHKREWCFANGGHGRLGSSGHCLLAKQLYGQGRWGRVKRGKPRRDFRLQRSQRRRQLKHRRNDKRWCQRRRQRWQRCGRGRGAGDGRFTNDGHRGERQFEHGRIGGRWLVGPGSGRVDERWYLRRRRVDDRWHFRHRRVDDRWFAGARWVDDRWDLRWWRVDWWGCRTRRDDRRRWFGGGFRWG
jgi:hypothetical protein